jgi:hypothetical protein
MNFLSLAAVPRTANGEFLMHLTPSIRSYAQKVHARSGTWVDPAAKVRAGNSLLARVHARRGTPCGG